MINKKTGAKVVDLFEALKQSLERPMTSGFCPDCSEVHDSETVSIEDIGNADILDAMPIYTLALISKWVSQQVEKP